MNATKSWFADHRSTFTQGMNYFNLANTAAYLTSAISEETYSILLLSGMTGGFAFNLLDGIASCAGDKAVSALNPREAKEKADLFLRAAKAKAAFEKDPDFHRFLELQFDFPASETFHSMGTWEQLKEVGSLLVKKPLSLYLVVKQNQFMWNTYGNLWYPLFFSQILPVSFQIKTLIDELPQDIAKLDGWLKTLQELGPDAAQELQKEFEPTLNRVIVRNPELGLELSELFQSLTPSDFKKIGSPCK